MSRRRVPRISGVLTVISFLVASARIVAQSPAAAVAEPAFDVASIRVNRSVVLPRAGFTAGGGFEAVGATLRQLVSMAHGTSRIVGAPSWFATERFDIVARPPANAAPAPLQAEQVLARLRTLLAQRFRLAVHREMRELPIYLLVIDGKDGQLGRRFRPAPLDCGARAAQAPPGTPGLSICGVDRAPGRSAGRTMTLVQLTGTLESIVDRPVFDRTGLQGIYDWDLEWTPAPGEPGPPGAAAPANPDAPSIFTAVQEQLGLRLDSDRAPVDVLVVDSVDRPTEN